MDHKNFTPYVENSASSWQNLLHLATPVRLNKNQTIYVDFSENYDFFFIEKGLITLKYYTINGSAKILNIFGENSLCLLVCMLTKTAPEEYHIIANKDSQLWKFNGKIFEDDDFFAKHPKAIREALQHIANNSMCLYNHATKVQLGNPKQKMARFLLSSLYEKKDKETFPSFSQEEIAQILSIHRVSVCRTLQEFKKNGIIEIGSKNSIEVLKEDELRYYLDEE